MPHTGSLVSIVKTLNGRSGQFKFASINEITRLGFKAPGNLPYCIKVLLENALRHAIQQPKISSDVEKIASWTPKRLGFIEIAFYPGRVLLQDFTGVPCIVDLAAMREAVKRLKGDCQKINPQVPCDLVIDHSLHVDEYGTEKAFAENIRKEFERNEERYKFLKWGQKAFMNFSVIPPGTGIIHQVNLEYLSKGILLKKQAQDTWIFPDSLVGTDSHTTMINGLGIVGWGVGGIEAEAVMLGEPINMLLPDVIGFKLVGKLNEGVTATDLVLKIVQILREKNVVEKFVEFYGEGYTNLSLPDRATISNMCPEYGATMGYMPIDQETLNYYKLTGRDPALIELIEMYSKEQGMFYHAASPVPQYSDTLELDLGHVTSCVAGPKRPQDRIILENVKTSFLHTLENPQAKGGFGIGAVKIGDDNQKKLTHGSVVIASITSCTNTSNPSVLIAAGLLAKKAASAGLRVPTYVKTSFAPGSLAVKNYLMNAGLIPELEKLGFHIVGYGCATCIGNSGPLAPGVAEKIKADKLVVTSVLSGNRNFEGRIHALVRGNYLASPPLVIAYALAGTVLIDFKTEPIGKDTLGREIFLKDIWPGQEEINEYILKYVTADIYKSTNKDILQGPQPWQAISASQDALFPWDKKSTYIQEPPFFRKWEPKPQALTDIKNARVLVYLGHSITTDHISPAGAIAEDAPAGRYLKSLGVTPDNFNTYGSRRGNDQVMTRGTFANVRLRNKITPDQEGPFTKYFPDEEVLTIFDAAQRYQHDGVPLLILAGKEYGSGSSRDWAAKGPALLGVKIVIAESFERIHRSNLVGMGILPLQFKEGLSADILKIHGNELFDFYGINADLKERQDIRVVIKRPDGTKEEFLTICRLDTPREIEYYLNGGILQTVLTKLMRNN